MSINIQNLARNHNVPDVAHTVTVLTCTGSNCATKTHRRKTDGTQTTDSFSAGKYFQYEEVSFDDLFGLYKIITKAAENPKKLIIRGRLKIDTPLNDNDHVRRTSRRQPTGEEPYFEDADRAWVMIDFDKVDNLNELEPTSSEAMEHIRTLLPPEFQGVECIYSLSASAGLTESKNISGHLWFLFDRPVSNQELKAWLVDCPVDKALFNAVQPHFIASPIFSDGLVDPIKNRKGLLPGQNNAVAVPKIDTSNPSYKIFGEGCGLEAARGYEAKISLLGDGDSKEGCHAVITSAIASYMSQHGPNADREALKADIRKHAAKAPWDRGKHSKDYVSREISEEVLDRSIQDWIGKSFIQCEGYMHSELDEVDVAREKVGQMIKLFVTAAKRWHENQDYWKDVIKNGGFGFFKIDEKYVYDMSPPSRYGLVAQVGLGKTEAYLLRLGELVRALRKDHCVFISVPNHDLSKEIKNRLHDLGIDAAVYLGPTQDDPDQSDKTMCYIPENLKIFQEAGIGSQLCTACPYHQQCGFQKQRTKKSSVWIGAHQLIYRKRGLPIPPVDFVIVDEDPLSGGIEGNNSDKPLMLRSDEVPDDIRKTLETLPLGVPLKRTNFNLSDYTLHKHMRAEYTQKQEVPLPEKATLEEIQHATEITQQNSAAIRRAKFYLAILKDGPWGMRAVKLDDGTVGVKWQRHRRIHKDFDVPILFADATFNEDAIEHIIDVERPPANIEEAWIDEDGSIVPAMDQHQPVILGTIKKVTAKTPYATFRQVLFSGAAAKFKDGDTGVKNIARIRRYIESRSSQFEKVLVICQLGLKQKLHELGLPPNVQIAHFNAIRGQDKWKDVDLLIVIGRTQPSPGAMELQAEALFRTPIKSLGPDYYDSAWMPLTGTETLVSTEQHPDRFAEIMRWNACEAEIIQAIGRARAVNRTNENPVQIDIINKVPLPDIEIDEVIEWNDAQPGPGAIIAGRYGVLLAEEGSKGTANILAALLPDLFGTVSAAKQAKVYSRAETPNKDYLLGVSAREYIMRPRLVAAPPIALMAAGCRYAVLATPLRAPTRRPLENGEKPPKGADINDDGVLAYGPVYVLKNTPRRLKGKLHKY
jgi:hypothetical protein